MHEDLLIFSRGRSQIVEKMLYLVVSKNTSKKLIDADGEADE